ncbi:MAG TPA: hypothetical protein VFF52_15845 [Isosphaeraceae bacterium]|nr:hypothetical protein [Isosphaeraceae bacterium]
MPIHDWTRVQAGDFHHFHQCWVVAIGIPVDIVIANLVRRSFPIA